MSVDMIAKAGREMAASSSSAYRGAFERGALRCGMGDAAMLCDVVARSILARHTAAETGRIDPKGESLAQAARDCGDAIWAMRDEVART